MRFYVSTGVGPFRVSQGVGRRRRSSSGTGLADVLFVWPIMAMAYLLYGAAMFYVLLFKLAWRGLVWTWPHVVRLCRALRVKYLARRADHRMQS